MHFSVLSRRPGYIIDVASLIIIIDTVSGAHCVYVVQICALLLSTVRVCEQPDKLMTGLLCPKVPLPSFYLPLVVYLTLLFSTNALVTATD